MLCSPLERTVLQAKILLAPVIAAAHLQEGAVESVLSKALDPPPLERVRATLRSLHALGALTSDVDAVETEVTAVGSFAATLQLSVVMARMILLSLRRVYLSLSSPRCCC